MVHMACKMGQFKIVEWMVDDKMILVLMLNI